MPFTGWNSYNSLLENLKRQSSQWEYAKDFAEFTEAINRSCTDLLGGEGSSYGDYGLTSLQAALLENLSEYDAVYEQIRLTALAVPAAELGYGQPGFVSYLANGTKVSSDSQFAEPSQWVQVTDPVTIPEPPLAPGGDQDGGLAFDEATGLFYDSTTWYLPDRTTSVIQLPGSEDVFADSAGNRYRLGEPYQWYDATTRLLYDDTHWYLPDGTTTVTQVPGSDNIFADSAGNRYRLGEPYQWYDATTRLLYDDTHWYLPDGTTAVTEIAGTDLFTDGAGNRYRLGQLVPDEPDQQEPDQQEPDQLETGQLETDVPAPAPEAVEDAVVDAFEEGLRALFEEAENSGLEFSPEQLAELYSTEFERLAREEFG
jgi:hypothetical protein